MLVLGAEDVSAEELQQVDEVAAGLPADSPLGEALRSVSNSVRTGQDVIVATGGDMTPAQAARVLRVSRVHLYKLMDAGEIAFVRVGRDRRLSMAEVAHYDTRRHADSAALAERFAHVERDRQQLVRDLATADSVDVE